MGHAAATKQKAFRRALDDLQKAQEAAALVRFISAAGSRGAALAAFLALAGCGGLPTAPIDMPRLDPIPNPSGDAAHHASMDCGGPWLSWSSNTTFSKWPYRIETTETMRCLNDGRIVGPYSYREDGL